ncbi:hypothetical protein A2239_03420 [Candidatus Uhrbacteria bacterium RIFOXYA2_FULL_40_9]|nr:MAG: hypothetical protein UT94_C0029G0005 [Candidatus Uhrbacteria bacterium GW2011_GWF2_40_263]OGL92785.1 MAG: hypothetical protein A2239_03420 [Candidatus Uhrbacteria bacterium RIFOXYA2_FULL_40_9]OGL97614.1 MAG: hypothetical protein A2332_01735 [Candidatus Uhrbacteria bacterium RIFOXYB2_FULL_41_18]HBK34384.1 hypothetical protein [Candidatus Uhrbacteria bacterium]HCB56066.1 hypothetical protein [Candidatus Uhrbacteria bacterium]
MHFKTSYSFIVVLFIAIFIGFIGFSFYAKPDQTDSELSSAETLQNENSTTTNLKQEQTDFSWEEIEAGNPSGPWSHNLMMTTSHDGITFDTPQLFLKRAGVPSIIADSQGRLIVAFQWFPQSNEGFDAIAVSFSDDQGKTWSDPESIVVEGLPEDYIRPYDPTLTLTEDEQIRLYFTSNLAIKEPNVISQIYSALSDDGIHYTLEQEARIALTNERVYDCAVARLAGLWYLTAPSKQGALLFTSSDGLSFTQSQTIKSSQNWTGNLLVQGEVLRFYGGGPGNIWWSQTSDGENWSKPQETNLTGGDPTVVQLENGDYLMIYVGDSKNK